MPKKQTKKNNLRVCSVCKKPGHNKARCSMNIPARIKSPGVKLIMSEKSLTDTRSPHVINLYRQDLWDNVSSQAPENNFSLFHFYHARQKTKAGKVAATPTAPNLKPEYKTTTGKFKSFFATHQPKVNLIPRQEKIKPVKPAKVKKERTPLVWPKLNFTWSRTLAGATLMALLVVAPLKAGSYYQEIKNTTHEVAAEGTQGFLALQESTLQILQADVGAAQNSTQNALENFNSALKKINENHQLLQKIAGVIPVVKGELSSRQNIITAGQKITMGNQHLLNGVIKSQADDEATLPEKIDIIVSHLDAAIPNYEAALADMENIKIEVLPLEYQALFQDFQQLFSIAVKDLKTMSELGRALNQIFGAEGRQRYLLVFQNPHEIRPTGGFIGSFAVLDIKDGHIDNIDLPPGGSYDLKGQLSQWVEPPGPLLLANSRWEFQDANWFPDFPASAEKLMWFYRHSRNRTVDGVIAVNASILERLLAIMGPVTEEKRQLELTAENAITTIQTVVETSADKADNKPKQILSDLAPRFIDFLQNIEPGQALPILTGLSEALDGKEIQAYFTDQDTQDTMARLNWDGEIKDIKEGQDYLLVVNTNIQGQKSDAVIKQTIEHQAVITKEGKIINTVAITRQHSGEPGEDFYGGTNIDYIRLYVPQGSRLISTEGQIWPHEKNFKAPAAWTENDEFLSSMEKELGFAPNDGTRITEEFGKYAFGNWIVTEPGETSQIVFTYELPFEIFSSDTDTTYNWQKIFDDDYITSDYQLIVQKQSGVISNFSSRIIYPDGWHPSWQMGPDATMAANGLSIDTTLDKDLNWGLIMKKPLGTVAE